MIPTAHRPCMSAVCSARRDSVRPGTYDYTRRPYVCPGMLAARIAGRRAELAFLLRSTWPRRPPQPAGIAPEMTTPAAATLTDPPSPGVAVAAADGATYDAMTEGRGATLGFATRRLSFLLVPSEPVASPTRLSNKVGSGRSLHL